MHMEVNRDRQLKFNIDGIEIGDTIIFCPNCDFQATQTGMKPLCPKCKEALHLTTLSHELVDLIQSMEKNQCEQ